MRIVSTSCDGLQGYRDDQVQRCQRRCKCLTCLLLLLQSCQEAFEQQSPKLNKVWVRVMLHCMQQLGCKALSCTAPTALLQREWEEGQLQDPQLMAKDDLGDCL